MATDRHKEFRKWLESQRQNENKELDAVLPPNNPLVPVTIVWYSVNDTNGTYHLSLSCDRINNDMPIKKANLDFATAESIDTFNKVQGRKKEHKFEQCGICGDNDLVSIYVRS